MIKIITLSLVLFFSASASASLIDFTTTPYASTFGTSVTTDTVDGVTFTMTATAFGADGFRQNFSGGLNFGKPGNGMTSLSIMSDTDIIYTSLSGKGNFITADDLPFDLKVNGSLVINDLKFTSSSLSTVSLGNISVSAGDTFLITTDYSQVTTFALSSAVLKALNFNKAPSNPTPSSTVPAPAVLWLLLSGLGLFRLGGLNKKTQSNH